MGYERAREDKRRLMKLYNNTTRNSPKLIWYRGAYYDARKGHIIRFSSTKSNKEKKTATNRNFRRNPWVISDDRGFYKKFRW